MFFVFFKRFDLTKKGKWVTVAQRLRRGGTTSESLYRSSVWSSSSSSASPKQEIILDKHKYEQQHDPYEQFIKPEELPTRQELGGALMFATMALLIGATAFEKANTVRKQLDTSSWVRTGGRIVDVAVVAERTRDPDDVIAPTVCLQRLLGALASSQDGAVVHEHAQANLALLESAADAADVDKSKRKPPYYQARVHYEYSTSLEDPLVVASTGDMAAMDRRLGTKDDNQLHHDGESSVRRNAYGDIIDAPAPPTAHHSSNNSDVPATAQDEEDGHHEEDQEDEDEDEDAGNYMSSSSPTSTIGQQLWRGVPATGCLGWNKEDARTIAELVFPVGSLVHVYVNPSDHSQSVLFRGVPDGATGSFFLFMEMVAAAWLALSSYRILARYRRVSRGFQSPSV